MGWKTKAGVGMGGATFLMMNQFLIDRTSGKHWPLAIRNTAYRILRRLIESVGVENVAVAYVDESLIDPKKQYLCGLHPHGALCLGALSWGCKTLNGDPPANRFSCVADVLLQLPIIGTLLSMGGGRSVAGTNVEKLLRSGESVAIWPGGIFEQLSTSHLKEVVYFQPNKGFIRVAIKFGIDLVPTYVFGENQIFKMFEDGGKPKTTGYYVAPFPGIDFAEFARTLSTRKKDIAVVIGEPIQVAKNETPTDEEVDKVFDQYIVGLEKAFYTFRDEYLPKEVGDRTLHIVMRQAPTEVRKPIISKL
jgi:hypothetical protein